MLCFEINAEYQTLLAISGFAAIVHVAEEYFSGWVDWANEFVSGVTVRQFLIINALFISLCSLAAILSRKYIVFSSSVFSLLLINSLAHIAPTIKHRTYSPGLMSAVLLFIPLGVFGYTTLLSNNIISNQNFLASLFLGFVWMSIPFIYQIIRISKQKN